MSSDCLPLASLALAPNVRICTPSELSADLEYWAEERTWMRPPLATGQEACIRRTSPSKQFNRQ